MNNISWGRLGKEEDDGERDFYWRYCADGRNLPHKGYEKTKLLVSVKIESLGNFTITEVSNFLNGEFIDVTGEVVAWAPLPLSMKIK